MLHRDCFFVASDWSIFPAYMVWLVRSMYQQFYNMIKYHIVNHMEVGTRSHHMLVAM